MEEFIEDLNSLDEEGKIKFTLEIEKEGSISFLDANIRKKEGYLEFSLYEKPYSSGQLLNFNSYHDIGCKKSLIMGETIRYCRLSDKREADLSKLKEKLSRNDYPPKLVDKIIKGTTEKFEANSKGKEKENYTYLTLPFPGQKKAKKLRKLSKRFQNLRISFKKRKNLGSILSKSFKYNNKIEKGIIYKLHCKCGNQYIGETGKTMETRLDQHKYSYKNGDVNNGPAAHGLKCNETMDWNSMQSLGQEKGWCRRKVTEGLWIQKLKPEVNLNKGWCPRGKWNS